MTTHAEHLLREVLNLPADERADVASELLASLDEATDPRADVEAAWAEEIEKRARRVLGGEASGPPWPEVRRRLEASLQKR
ncbi:MAG TPA: addiction module protein [Thermoanaerobaculia bacterium]|nr:addiction module protein [Thermoanaerobaculia bacterium]